MGITVQDLRALITFEVGYDKFAAYIAAFDVLAIKAVRTDALEAENAALVKERDDAHAEIERLTAKLGDSRAQHQKLSTDCGFERSRHGRSPEDIMTENITVQDLRAAAAQCLAPEQFEAFESIIADGDTGDRLGRCIAKRNALAAKAAPQQASEQRAAVDDDERAAIDFYARNPSAAVVDLLKRMTPTQSAAVATLTHLGYTWNGGEMWKPPLGEKPKWVDEPVCVCGNPRSLGVVHRTEGPCYLAESQPSQSSPVGLTDEHLTTLWSLARQVDASFWMREAKKSVAYAVRPVTKAASDGVALTDAARDVLAERQRQVSVEGWTPEHDDEHDDGDMREAAICYTQGFPTWGIKDEIQRWPWTPRWWKPTTPRRDLVKAGALILAEIERIDRRDGVKE